MRVLSALGFAVLWPVSVAIGQHFCPSTSGFYASFALCGAVYGWKNARKEAP